MTGANVIPFPGRNAGRALIEIGKITRLAKDAEQLLSRDGRNLDLPGLLDLLDQSSQTLAELGALLLTGEDRRQMEIVLASLDRLIARTRDRLGHLNHIAGEET